MKSQQDTKSEKSFISIGFFSALFLIFLTLKLTGHIDWSWWWVTAPLWGGIAIFLALAALVITIVIIVKIFNL